MTTVFSRNHTKHDKYYRGAYINIILTRCCLQHMCSSSVSRNCRTLNLKGFFNSCKVLCSSVETMGSWKTHLPCFVLIVFLVFSFLKKDQFLPISLKMSIISTFAFKDSHGCHQCPKANSIKVISTHSQPRH